MKRYNETEIIHKDTTKLSRHTLDSDEEPIQDDVGYLNKEELQGEEPPTLDYDGEIKITPFNMKEELDDDGHFDSNGTFIFKKTNDIGDNWLEDIDWSAVKRNENNTNEQIKQTNLATENDKLPPISADERIQLYQQVSELMQSKETVLKSLKRMGAKISSHKRSWIRNKDGSKGDKKDQPANENSQGFSKLTELANELMNSGDFDIYQKTKEIIDDLVSTSNNIHQENELDAFGSALDNAVGIDQPCCESNVSDSQLVTKWILKTGGTDADTDIEGPYTTEEIKQQLADSVHPDIDNVYISRQGQNEVFYQLTKMDFSKIV